MYGTEVENMCVRLTCYNFESMENGAEFLAYNFLVREAENPELPREHYVD